MGIMRDYGMVLPTTKNLQVNCPTLFSLLMPHQNFRDEIIKYNHTIHWITSTRRTTVAQKLGPYEYDKETNGNISKLTTHLDQTNGWSNIPIMLWVLGILMQRNHLSMIDEINNIANISPKYNGNLLDLFQPHFKIPDNSSTFTLRAIVNILLEGGKFGSFMKQVNNALQDVDKDDFYNDLPLFFLSDIKLAKNPKQDEQVAAASVPPTEPLFEDTSNDEESSTSLKRKSKPTKTSPLLKNTNNPSQRAMKMILKMIMKKMMEKLKKNGDDDKSDTNKSKQDNNEEDVKSNERAEENDDEHSFFGESTSSVLPPDFYKDNDDGVAEKKRKAKQQQTKPVEKMQKYNLRSRTPQKPMIQETTLTRPKRNNTKI
jgi:hypothetical protein